MAAAPGFPVLPSAGRRLRPYAATARAAAATRALVREVEPDLVVADVLSVAAGLAAELEARPWATLVPHLLPLPEPGLPPFSCGARPPRTRSGRRAWAALDPLWLRAMRSGRDELNAVRRRLGLAPSPTSCPASRGRSPSSPTFPQLEPREPRRALRARDRAAVVGAPAEHVDPPEGDEPLVIVAPSTSQDPGQRMLRAALEGLADEPVRVLASTAGGACRPACACPRTPHGGLGLLRPNMPRAADSWSATAGHGTWRGRSPRACRCWPARRR